MPNTHTPPPTLWNMSQIAAELGVPYRRVEKWRRGRIKNFPEPLPLDHPHHPDQRRPWWPEHVIRQWAIHAGRMNDDGTLRNRVQVEAPVVVGLSYDELVNDRSHRWEMPEIARQLKVEQQTVRMWRRNFRKNPEIPHPNRLPPPDGTPQGIPWWWAGTIRRWAMQTGRMDREGNPMRAKPPGRIGPRKAA